MRLKLWCAIVVCACVAGTVFGYAIGQLLSWVSGDYVISVGHYVSQGLRAGLLGGTILAAANVLAPRPLNRPLNIARAFLLAGLVAIGLVCAAAVVGLLMPFVNESTAAELHLGHPRRYALFSTLDQCWLAAMLGGAVAGSAWSWRLRGRREAMGESQSKQ